jgi:hypothetical protein
MQQLPEKSAHFYEHALLDPEFDKATVRKEGQTQHADISATFFQVLQSSSWVPNIRPFFNITVSYKVVTKLIGTMYLLMSSLQATQETCYSRQSNIDIV